MPQGYTASSIYFSQILKMNLDDLKFPRHSILIQHVDDLFLCSATLSDSQGDTAYLLQQLASRKHKISEDKLQFCLPKVKYLRHLTAKDGLLINPE